MTLFNRAAEAAGLDPRAVGEDGLRRAARIASGRLGLAHERELPARLAADPGARRLFCGQAVVQETWLFRDPEAFRALARLAPALPRPVRVLCVPCSTGEEPAGAAMALLDAGLAPGDFRVDAVDACPEALAQARTGRFGPHSLRAPLPDPCPWLRREDDLLVLVPAALESIRFLEGDVLAADFLAHEPPYHAVFCRHMLIYTAQEARARLAANLRRLLGPGGALFTAPAEGAAFLGLGLVPHGLRAPTPPTRNAAGARPDGLTDRPASRLPEASRAGGAPGGSGVSRGPGAKSAQPAPEASGPDLLESASVQADAGRLDEALATLDQALSALGPSARLYHLRAAALLALGREAEAELALRSALYLDPGHLESLTHLELLERAHGRLQEAELLQGRLRRILAEARP
ncbi:putative biofilm formation methyltransferase WspC [Fundidesulfovibrio magnetotacticus]|uniref:Putative biofilm formation methyltransferase WspC n=1 Tax=Fundidesulfovibrio magnetotacticus TaxID=2730080 RepID=A0A6V8LK61_9BACT|nr:CheR family methyltransferase [Fundidesulfovibrio magnetotacticus]GFK93103.1 putative biofilm formation methyltransferase WspC [Fundidesulfovibrio magnetotacticus]